MSKPVSPTPTNVIPITEKKRTVIATDERSKRFILAIGQQRIAFDFMTRVTELRPHTGDQPAPVLPITKRQQTDSMRQRRKRVAAGSLPTDRS